MDSPPSPRRIFHYVTDLVRGRSRANQLAAKLVGTVDVSLQPEMLAPSEAITRRMSDRVAADRGAVCSFGGFDHRVEQKLASAAAFAVAGQLDTGDAQMLVNSYLIRVCGEDERALITVGVG